MVPPTWTSADFCVVGADVTLVMPCLGWFPPLVVLWAVVAVDDRFVVAVDLDVVVVAPATVEVVVSPGAVVSVEPAVVAVSSEVDVVAPALLLFLPPPPQAPAIKHTARMAPSTYCSLRARHRGTATTERSVTRRT